MTMHDDDPDEPFGAELVRTEHKLRLEAAAARYEAIINRLWAGCGGGLIASITAIRHPADPFFWLSAGSFGLGVLLLGVGALSTLIRERRVIRHLEDIDGFLQMRADYVERPSEHAGLVMSHPQSWTASMTAGLFVLGVVFAGVLISRH